VGRNRAILSAIDQKRRLIEIGSIQDDLAGVHANPHRFRHTFATWAIENHARELDVQYLLGHSTSAMVRRYSATYDAAKAADAHAAFSPAARLLAAKPRTAG